MSDSIEYGEADMKYSMRNTRFFMAVVCVCTAILCASCAGGVAGNNTGGVARITFASSRAGKQTEDFRNIVLEGSYNGRAYKKLGSWSTGSELAGTSIEVEAGYWDFKLTAAVQPYYEESIASTSATLEPDTTTSLTFNTTQTGKYIVPINELSTWTSPGGTLTVTITKVTNDNIGTLGSVLQTKTGSFHIKFEDSSFTTISANTFASFTRLRQIDLPSSINSIGDNAFYGCTALTSITIHSSITSLGTGAFSGCFGLTSITIPSSITSLGTGAFSGCSSLSNINFGGTASSFNTLTGYNPSNYFSGVAVSSVSCSDDPVGL